MSTELPWLDRLAHDLRGPLSPLQTAAYLLRSGGLDADKQAELVEMIERQTQRLASMIDEISDLARASRGRLVAGSAQAVSEATLLVDYACSGIASGVPRIEDTAPGARVAGDEGRLVQLLRIVLSAPYSPEADAASRVLISREGTFIRFDVDDPSAQLPDVPPEQLLQLPIPEPGDGGLGLGLVIAAAIAAAHGGRLEARALDQGIRFSVLLPELPAG